MSEQQCLILIKPDGIHKSLTGNIISALAETKLKLIAAKVVSVKRELAEKHYNKLKEEKGEEIYEDVLKYIQGEYHTNKVMALVYQGENAIQKIREIAGATNPEKAHPESIRGKFGRIHSETKVFENVIHASDSEENAKREVQLWFSPEELTENIYPTKIGKVEEERLIWE